MTKEYILSVFLTIITIVDPLGILPIYMPLASKLSREKQKKLILKAFFYALAISSIFLLIGKPLFHYLEIDFHAVYIVGGILLFKIGIDMVFAKPKRKEETSHVVDQELYKDYHNIAVYPLAIPLLSGPGTLAAIIMFSNKYSSLANYGLIFTAILTAFTLAALTMFFSNKLLNKIGPTGLDILDRVMGIILCSLAVQFIINALTSIVKSNFF